MQKPNQKLSRKRQEYIRYVISVLVKTKPKYITIENLNISGMLKNKHLSKAIAEQNLYQWTKRNALFVLFLDARRAKTPNDFWKMFSLAGIYYFRRRLMYQGRTH